MSEFYLDIGGVGSVVKYLQVKHEDTEYDEPVLKVARVLDKEDSWIEAEKIVKRYNAYGTLIEAIKAVRRTCDDVDTCQSLERLLQRYDEAPTGQPTT